MPIVTINPENFAISISGRPIDEVIQFAAGEVVTESEVFAPSVNREDAGAFVQAIGKEGPSGSFLYADGAEPPYVSWTEGNVKVWEFKKYGVAFGVTEMTLDNARKRGEGELVLRVEDMVEKIKRAHRITREQRCVGALLNAHDSTYAFEVVTTEDGQALFSDSHSYANTARSLDNYTSSASAPSASTINTARLNLWAIRDAQGSFLPYEDLDLLCSPTTSNTNNLPSLFTSQGNVDDAAERDVNPLHTRLWGSIRLAELRWMTTSTNWYLVKRNSKPMARFVRRPVKAISDYNEITETRVHVINEWDTIACVSWQDGYANVT